MSDTRQYRYNMENVQARHACYIKRKAEVGTKERSDKKVMTLGYEWYISGHKLEEADPKLQSSTSFRQGYERAERIDKINADLYQLGREFFDKDVPLVNISSKYTSNEHFLRGYNDALSLSLQKSRPRG